ncbi:MAG: pyridoxamine 5'-phosphate oxidase [Flavobacteriales bacterium]|nr:pyridoxamine 5'-phosphate oxidase [Flavobacteriales bacterium]
MDLFSNWFSQALDADKDNAISFVLSTVSQENIPSSRVLLMRKVDENGFTFFTNYDSSKSKDIENNHFVSINFFWNKLEKQIRIIGKAIKVPAEDSDTYFNSRPEKSKIGAVISNQSSIIDFNLDFEELISELDLEKQAIERPKNWGGYKVIPTKIEFWQGRPSRLHDRVLYVKTDENNWKKERLAP